MAVELKNKKWKTPSGGMAARRKNCNHNKLLPVSIASSPCKNSLKPKCTNPPCKKAFDWMHNLRPFWGYLTSPILSYFYLPYLSSLTALELWIWKFWEGFSVALEDLTELRWWVCGVLVIADSLEQFLIFPCTLMWAGLHRSPTKLFSAFHSFSLKAYWKTRAMS